MRIRVQRTRRTTDAQRKPRVIRVNIHRIDSTSGPWLLWTHIMNYYVRWGDNFVDVSPIIFIGFDRRRKILVSLMYLLKMNTPPVGTYYSLLIRYINSHVCLWFQRDILVYSLSLVVRLNKISMFVFITALSPPSHSFLIFVHLFLRTVIGRVKPKFFPNSFFRTLGSNPDQNSGPNGVINLLHLLDDQKIWN